jgi:glycosyltransferase involved in cell wall biosynthesis
VQELPVTVLITVRNNIDTINRCIESVLNLNYENYMVLVIDAFSTDGTYEVLRNFHKKIELYRLHGSAPVAYNWAINKIKTEYIALIDGDCIADRNWLKELVAGFKSPEILAVAGYCGTPSGITDLQHVIGIELEDKFAHMPEFPAQAPTMNLCVRTETAKKLRFDSSLRVGYDSDFCYRLNKIGKIYYNPKAIVYHFHRATWRGVLRQQYTTATMMPRLYTKHKKYAKGTNISKPSMIVQPFLFYIAIIAAVATLIDGRLIFLSLISLVATLAIWVYDVMRLTKSTKDALLLLEFFACRLLGWIAGLPVGVFFLIKGHVKSRPHIS